MKQKYSQISETSEKWSIFHEPIDISNWTLEDYASWYIQMGFNIIPLKAKTKEPLFSWKEYQNRSATLEELMKWFQGKTPEEVGIGIICGSVSGNLIVLDFDDLEVWNKLNPEYFESEHFLVNTGSGKKHLYLGSRKPVRKTNNREIGLDIQGEGSYVVAPPSIHPSGGQYRIHDINKPIHIVEDAIDVANMIAEDLGVTRPSKIEKSDVHIAKLQSPLTEIRPCIQAMIDCTHPIAIDPEDGDLYHDARFIVASEGFALGYDDRTTSQLFEKQRDYDTEKSLYHVQSLRDSNKGYWGCKAIQEHGWCLGESCKYYPRYGKTVYSPSDFFTKNAETGKIKQFIPEKLSETIQTQHKFFATSEKSYIWVYNQDKGIWEPNGEQLIQETATELLGDLFKTHYITETMNHIRYTNYIDEDLLGNHPNQIVMKNGVYSLKTGQLTGFDPEMYAINCIPVAYDPDAECPRIMQFINDISPEQVDALYELVGYCLLDGYPLRYVTFLYGSGFNGKSTFLELLERFLGIDNISSVSLEQLVADKYMAGSLYGKLANLAGDIPDKLVQFTGMIKSLTGRDLIECNVKYKDSMRFRNRAKLVFSCNSLPPTLDNTDAWYDRVYVIGFPNQFKKGEAGTDPDILSKITTKEELSGLFNLAIKAVHGMLSLGKYAGEESIEEKERKYLYESDPAKYFCKYLTKPTDDPNRNIPKAVLYSAYRKWCTDNRRKIVSDTKFTRIAKTSLPHIDEKRLQIGHGYDREFVQVWLGIELNLGSVQSAQAVQPISTKNTVKKGMEKFLEPPEQSAQPAHLLIKDEENEVKGWLAVPS